MITSAHNVTNSNQKTIKDEQKTSLNYSPWYFLLVFKVNYVSHILETLPLNS